MSVYSAYLLQKTVAAFLFVHQTNDHSIHKTTINNKTKPQRYKSIQPKKKNKINKRKNLTKSQKKKSGENNYRL